MANILPQLTRLAAETFVAGLWQGLALIAAVGLALRLFSRIPASVRFVIWSLAFALVVAMPLLRLRVPATPIGHTSSAVVHLSPIWAVAIAALWSLLTLARLVQFSAQTVRLLRIWKHATPVVAPEAVRVTIDTTRRNVELCTSTDVDTPCVIGFFSPRLLIPQSLFNALTPTDLQQIVLHECEHLRRHDDWINLAQKLALALFPLNPALLFADHRLSLERELACDAGVIARTEAPFDYAHCLTRLAEHRLNSGRLSLALSAWNRQSELARRVHTLLSPIRKLSPAYTRVSIAAFTVALTAGAVELAHAPHLVSFTNPVVPVASGVDTVFRSAPPAYAIPVVYMQSEQPRATLLKEMMPSVESTPKPYSQSAGRPNLNRARRPAPLKQPQTRLLRTSTPSRVSDRRENTIRAYYVTTEFSPTYAAVPFGDGWLIVQL